MKKISEEIIAEITAKREEKKLSHDKIFFDTKIPVPELKAIESGDLEYFGNDFYARSFIKQYAAYLGIDLSSKNLIITTPSEEEIAESELNEGKPLEKQVKKEFPKPNNYTLYIIVILIFAAFIEYSLLSKKNWNLNKKYTTQNSVREAPEETLPETEKPHRPRKMYIKCVAITDTWIRLTSEGEIIEETTLKAGTSTTYESRKNIKLRIGNVEGLKVYFKKNSRAEFEQVDIVEGNKKSVNEIEFRNDVSQLYYSQ